MDVTDGPSHFCMLESLTPRITHEGLVCPLIGDLLTAGDRFPHVTMLAADRIYENDYARFRRWTERLVDKVLAHGMEPALRSSHVVNKYELIWQGLYGNDTDVVKELIEYFGMLRKLHVLVYDPNSDVEIPPRVVHVVKMQIPEQSLRFFHSGEMMVPRAVPLEQIVGVYSRCPAIANQQLASVDAKIAVLPFPDKAKA